MTTYNIIGAGSSSGNPVTVFAGCEETVNICWTGRIEVDGYCSECTYHDDQYCSSVSGVTESTTGTIPWSGGTSVHYEIIKNCVPEPVPQPCSSYTCSDFSLYTVPSYIDLVNPPTNIDIHYNYLITYKDDDGHICGREELSNVDSIDFDDFEPSGDTKYVYDFTPLSGVCSATSGVATVYVLSDEDTCDSGVTVDITTLFSPSVVPGLPSSGTDVTISVMSRKVEVNKDCTKVVTNSGDTLTWHVKCCSSCTENSGCCADHTVSSAFTMNYIKGLAGLTGDEDAVIRYNGVKVTSNSIPYSIIQKAKDTEECSASTEDKVTKYCVSSCAGDVEYEDSYMSNTWSGTCVPFGGGRIKVSWDYSAFTYSCVDSDCTLISHSDSAMTWEEIINIPACDEMDSTCDYTERGDDGKVSGTCELYFKEQALSADCTTCDGEVPPGETEKFNVITYTFVQDCKSECTPYTNTIYGNINPETGEIEKVSAYTSDYVEDSKCCNEDLEITVSGIPYTSVTEYVGSLCPERKLESGDTSTTVTVKMIPNNSPSARTIFENDMICVVQEAGPCDDDTLCGAEVTLISGLTRGDYALVAFYSGDTVTPSMLQATYSIKNGEMAGYYSEDEYATVDISSDPDNNNDYIYKYLDTTQEIPSGIKLGCGEDISSAISAVAESYCACKKLKGVTGGTVPATGGSGIEVATYSATTCTGEWKLSAMTASEDTPNIIDLSTIEFDNDNGVLKATVNSACTERTGDYVIYNTVTSTSCKTGSFTVTQSAYECGCSDMNFDVSPSSVEIGQAQGSSAEVTISNYGCCLPYSTAVVEGGTWLDASLVGDKVTITTLAANPEVATRTGTVKFIAVEGGSVCNDGSSIEVTQAGAECNCDNMHFEVSPTAVTLGSEAGSSAEVSITNYVCIPPVSDMDDWLDITLNESEDKFIISSKTANESSEERVGTIEFKFNEGDEPCSSPTITVTQSGQEIPGCPEMNRQGTEIPAGDGSSGYPIAYWTPSDDYPLNTFSRSYTGEGITDVELTTITFGADTVNAIILKCSANPSTTPRDFKIELTTSVNEDCDWIFELTQDGTEPTPTCGCDSITYEGTEESDPTPGSCSCSDITSFPTTYGSDFTFVTFTQGATSMTITYTETCEMYVENEVSDWLTVTKETSDLKFTVTGQTTDYRSGTVFIRPSSTGDVCKTIVVQQYPNETCACSDLTWKISPYQPNFTTLYDLEIDECDGLFSISYYVKKKSDGSDVFRVAGGWEDQDISHSVTCSPDDGPNLTDEDKVYSVYIEADLACECETSDLEVTYIQPPCYTGCATADRGEEHQGQEPDEHWHTWVKLTNNVGDEYDGYAKIKLRSYQNGTGWNDYVSEDTVTVHSGVGNQYDLGIFNGSYTGFYIWEVLYACDRKGRKLDPCD